MKTRIVTALFLMIVLTGSIAFAEGSKTDGNCVKGGLGIPINKFIIGFGYRTYSSALGADTGRVQLGFGIIKAS